MRDEAACAPFLSARHPGGLAAARCFISFLTGFVTMEIDGNFGFDGPVEEAFRYSVATILKGLASDA